MSGFTILDDLDRQAKERRFRPALLEPKDPDFNQWETLTWGEYQEAVYRTARALISAGHGVGQGVAIIGPNRPAWVLSAVGAVAAGGMPAGIYATATDEQAAYIVGHCDAAVAVVQDHVQAEKLIRSRDSLPKLCTIVLFPGQTKKPDSDALSVLTWEEFWAKAEETPAERLDMIRGAMKPEDTAGLIYTSGTTGPPKAVMLTHHNMTWTSQTIMKVVTVLPGDRTVSYLPLPHVAEQLNSIFGALKLGLSVHFCPEMERLGDALVAARPHVFFGVPRVWEKIQAKVEAKAATAPKYRRALLRTAQKVGLPVTRARYEGQTPSAKDAALYSLFHKLVYGKFRAALGFDETRIFVTGAAPMSPKTREWYLSLGIGISEVYGQSEDTGPTSFNKAGDGKIGTVGRPIPDIEVKIADDGEILVRGPNVFKGYFKDPAATDATLQDGWLHSGDVGQLGSDGFLRITDRKKDLIITAGGKNIAPQNIESHICDLPLVSQAVVIGDHRKYLSALIALDPEAVERHCRETGIPQDPDTLHTLIEGQIQSSVNPKLARYETIKRVALLPQELTVETGELTPTMKVKRRVVNERYADLIETMYDVPEARAS